MPACRKPRVEAVPPHKASHELGASQAALASRIRQCFCGLVGALLPEGMAVCSVVGSVCGDCDRQGWLWWRPALGP